MTHNSILTHAQAIRKYLYGCTTEYLEIGSTPTDEDCTQITENDAHVPDQLKECRAFINQIKRQMPPPAGAEFFITKNFHDFGVYYNVAVAYELPDEDAIENPESFRYAQAIEVYPYPNWDIEALKELRILGHSKHIKGAKKLLGKLFKSFTNK